MKDEPAFARAAYYAKEADNFHSSQEGMTLRDYFAAKAMQSYLEHPPSNINPGLEWEFISEKAYKVADAMLKEREE